MESLDHFIYDFYPLNEDEEFALDYNSEDR